jgi:predicted Fe-S protein YdhL (DUF1289 family)
LDQAMAVIESPCVNVCVAEPVSGLCVGCGRSLNEIGAWIRLTPDQRTRVMAELPRRLSLLRQPHKTKSNRA